MSAMETRSGQCKGGPWDGQMFAHYADTKELLEPRMAFSLSLRDPEIIPTKIGEYYWGKHGLWIWLPEGVRSRRSVGQEVKRSK